MIAREVVVALVLVLCSAVKFWSVDEPVTRRLPKVPNPEAVSVDPLPVVKNRLVEKKFEVVA